MSAISVAEQREERARKRFTEKFNKFWAKIPHSPPTAVKNVIVSKYDSITGDKADKVDKANINHVFKLFAEHMLHEQSDENLLFLIALDKAKALFDTDRKDLARIRDNIAQYKRMPDEEKQVLFEKEKARIMTKFRAVLQGIYSKYVVGDSPINIGRDVSVAKFREASAGGEWPKETDPYNGIWAKAEGEIKYICRSDMWTRFVKPAVLPSPSAVSRAASRAKEKVSSMASGVKKKFSKANVAYHNEGYYVYESDSVDNSEFSYLSNGGRGYSMGDSGVRRGAYIGHGSNEFLDPSLAVIGFLIAGLMCVLCIVFTAIASWAVGYWTRWFKEDLLNRKKREEEYVCEEV